MSSSGSSQNLVFALGGSRALERPPQGVLTSSVEEVREQIWEASLVLMMLQGLEQLCPWKTLQLHCGRRKAEEVL